MARHLNENLDPEIKRRLEAGALKELLLALADWVYLERFKAVTEFTSEVANRPRANDTRDIELRGAVERAKEKAEKPSFLDALDEIS